VIQRLASGGDGVAETAVGRVGTLICYDGFNVPHTTREPDWRPVGGTFTDQGVHIVAQPAANPWRWDEAWVHAPPGAGLLRREQWCAEGLEARLSELDGVSYGVTAHLVGRVLGQEFEGCSAIYQRSDTGAVRRLAEAPSKDQECVVHARVEAPWLA
jgi:predicted amidohydrolase